MRRSRFGWRFRAVAGATFAVAVTGSCQWQRVGSDTGPDPSVVVPELFEPAALYRAMGLIASGAPLPFVGNLRYLATASPDTTVALFGLSLANEALTFRRTEAGYEAGYVAELTLRREGRIAARVSSRERVLVGTREEARRADESVVFQQLLRVPPGAYAAVAAVRDEQTGTTGRIEQAVTVPHVRRPGFSQVLAVYRGGARAALGDVPQLLLNPRATVPFGLDTLHLFVEAYGARSAAPVRFVLTAPPGDSMLVKEATPVGDPTLASATVSYTPDELPVGELRVEVTGAGLADTARLRVLVSFSDQWAITNFDEILTLLRYFGHDRALDSLRAAPPERRAALWRDFWRATDPNPPTPQNEALELYFRRVHEANLRFRETGVPGWMTDRGEVFITLGEPDEIFDSSSDLQGPTRIVRWNYLGEQLTVDFVDDTGFGRYRLTPASRADYQRVLNRVRSRG